MEDSIIKSLIYDYADKKYNIYEICYKYHIGKIKAKEILEKNGIEIRGRGGQKTDKSAYILNDYKIEKYKLRDGYHYVAYDPKKSFESTDISNKSGCLTSYIEKEYGIKTPTLYDRRKYYMMTGNYWWEQWLSVKEVKDGETKKCPYCDWETIDVDNRSGAFAVHLQKEHNISKSEHLLKHPEDKEFFTMANHTANLQLETDENEFVECKICGKKLRRITDVHLKKHNLTKKEYMDKFSLSSTTCNSLHKRLSEIGTEANINMERFFSSSQEKEIKDFIESFGVECYTDRKILHGKELDIFIPSKNVAIEFNGNLWHSEKFGKDKNYHLNKLIECNQRGIKLLQIFEDEYAEHKEIVLSKIKHILGLEGKNSIKIPGRKCKISLIKYFIAEDFLKKYHIQGFTKSTVYIGAYYEKELIAVMSFLNEKDNEWNLTRFASKNGTVCMGVGGKMFSYFINNFKPQEVKSFADRRWTLDEKTNLYTKLGFILSSILKPEYRYYNSKIDRYKRFHKFNFRKQILHKKYGLPLSMTEKEMTEKLGYIRIYDCGLFKYVWRNPVKKENETLIAEETTV